MHFGTRVVMVGLGFIGLCASAGHADLRAFYDFDVNTTHPFDLSGHGVPAETHGATWDANGHEGGAFSFDGVDDTIRVELDLNPLMHAMPQVTFGAFVRLDEVTDWVYMVMSADDYVCDRSIAADRRLNGTMYWTAFPGGCPTAGPEVEPGTWTLVVAVYDQYEQTMRLHVGTEAGGLTEPFVLPAAPGRSLPFLEIGGHPLGGSYFRGAIDNVFVFEGLLDEPQIEAIRVGGSAAILATDANDSERARFSNDGYMPDPDPNDVIRLTAMQAEAGNVERPLWRYTTSASAAGGQDDPFLNPEAWMQGPGGFGFPENIWERDTVGTPWTEHDLWLWATFELTADDLASETGAPIALWGRWAAALDVWINGEPAAVEAGNYGVSQIRRTGGYRYLPLMTTATTALRAGTNTIAVHARGIREWESEPYGGPYPEQYVDLGIVRNPFADLPTTGTSINPALHVFRETAREIAAAAHIPAATIAVVRDGRLVLNHGIGFADKHQKQLVAPDAYFRLASLSKPPAAAAVRTLIRDGAIDPVSGVPLTLDAPIWPFLEARGLMPFPGETSDPNAGLVTIEDLLYHRGGLPGWRPIWELADATGKRDEELNRWDMLRGQYGQQLLFRPGSECAYSNEGYFLQRDLVDRVTGSLVDYLNAPAFSGHDGVGLPPFRLANEALAARHPNEPWYRTLEWPWARGLYLEEVHSLAAHASGYAVFADRYAMPHGNPVQNQCCSDSSTCHECCQKGGLMPGTSAIVKQRFSNGHRTTFVVLTNQDNTMQDPRFPQFYPRFIELVDTLDESAWFCPADIDHDDQIGLSDLAVLLGAFGTTSASPADLNGDGVVDLSDLAELLNAYGQVCE